MVDQLDRPGSLADQRNPPPAGLTPGQVAEWERQERFLLAYCNAGNIRAACGIVGLHRSVPYRWQHDNVLDFPRRFQESHSTFCDLLENEVRQVLTERPHQHDLLRMAELNANHPRKWRPNQPPPPDPRAERILTGMERIVEAARQALELARSQPQVEAPGVIPGLPPGVAE